MENWNQDGFNSGVQNDLSGAPIGYEAETGVNQQPAVEDGRRNYEKYMAGETWTPENNASDMTSGNNDYGYQSNAGGYMPIQNTANIQGLEEPVSMGEWIVTMLLMMIPCVNIILMFVWAFGNSEKKSKSNYFKATLIMAGIGLAIYLVFVILIVSAGVAIGGF